MPELLSTSKSKVLYLLHAKNTADFKVGVSANIHSRISSLPQDIDLEQSLYVDCSSLSARRIEQTVHAIFHKFQVDKYTGEGKTEWFSGDCFEEVKEFLAINAERLGCSKLKKIPVKISQPIDTLGKSLGNSREARLEKARQREIDWQERKMLSVRRSEIIFSHTINLLNLHLSSEHIIGRGFLPPTKYGIVREFLAFKASPDTMLWRKSFSANEITQSGHFVSFENIKCTERGMCFSSTNYLFSNLFVGDEKGELWHTINRPPLDLIEEAGIFIELNSLLDKIPMLSNYQLAKGRKQLLQTEMLFWGRP